MKVENNIAISLDKGQVTVLTLLDLSAAFDTIDHTTLTDRLAKWHGVSVSIARLCIGFRPYLRDMCQKLKFKTNFLLLLSLYVVYHKGLY